jgi:putative ABC transport system permease protein
MGSLFRLLSGRYLWGHKRRTFLTLTGILLGVTLIMGVLLVNKAILVSYERSVTDLSGKSQLQVSAAVGLPESALQEVAGIDKVSMVAPVVSNSTFIAKGEKRSVVLAFGIDPAVDSQVRTYTVKEGRMVQPGDEKVLAITTAVAEAIGAEVGDEVDVLTTNGQTKFKVVGLLAVSGPAQVSLGQFAAAPITQIQKGFDKEDKFDQLDILLASDNDYETVRQKVADKLGGKARVGRPADRTKELENQLDSVRVMLLMASFIALFAASFIIYTNVRTGVEQRRHELSILRALGMGPRQVIRLVVGEALVLGVIGSGLGAIMGIGFSQGMIPTIIEQTLAIYNFSPTDMPVTAVEMGLSLGIGIGITLLASYLPARETMSIRPVDGLRSKHDVESGTKPSVWPPVIGVLLSLLSVPVLLDSHREEPLLPTGTLSYTAQFAASFVALLGLSLLTPLILRTVARLLAGVLERMFGTPGRLAADNMVRTLGRGSAAVNSLLVALSMVVAVGGLSFSARETSVKWMEDSLRWDLWVYSSMAGTSSRVTMDEGFGDELEKLPGVQMAVPYRFATVDLGELRPALWSYDMPEVREVFKMKLDEGEEETVWKALEAGGSVAISTPIAQSLGYKIGDEIELKTPNGPQKFKVAGITQEIIPASAGTITMNRADYITYWDDRSANSFALRLAPGTSLEATRAEITRRWGDKYDFQVLSVADMKQKTQQGIDGFWAMSNALVMMSILVACLAVFNSMTSSLLERTREIGMLKAIGANDRHIGRMVVLESLLIGLVGGLVGLSAGLALSWTFVSALARNFSTVAEFFFPGWPVGVAIAVVFLLIPFTGWLANRPTRRMRLVEALQYE